MAFHVRIVALARGWHGWCLAPAAVVLCCNDEGLDPLLDACDLKQSELLLRQCSEDLGLIPGKGFAKNSIWHFWSAVHGYSRMHGDATP